MAKIALKHEPRALSMLAICNEEDAPMKAARLLEEFSLLPNVSSEMA